MTQENKPVPSTVSELEAKPVDQTFYSSLTKETYDALSEQKKKDIQRWLNVESSWNRRPNPKGA